MSDGDALRGALIDGAVVAVFAFLTGFGLEYGNANLELVKSVVNAGVEAFVAGILAAVGAFAIHRGVKLPSKAPDAEVRDQPAPGQ